MSISPTRRATPIVGVLMAIVAMLSAACGGSSSNSTSIPTQSAGPREPKDLEAKITIDMGELFFATGQGAKGGPFRVPAGKTVGIHIVNKGAIDHEIMFGRDVAIHEGTPDGYQVSLFKSLPADVFVYPSGKKAEVETGGALEGIELEAGADAWIRVKFPADIKGQWEFGCFVPGHFEGGMKATLIIE